MSVMLPLLALLHTAQAEEGSQREAHAADLAACARDDASACVRAAKRTIGGAPGVLQDRIATYDLLLAACELGDQEGCVELGWSYVKHTGAVHDPPAAGPLWQTACEAGQVEGCASWGRFLWSDLVEVPQPEQAAAAFEQACTADDRRACSMLGEIYWRGRGRPQDLERAREILAKACDLGAGEGCASLGLMHELGHGGPADLDRAVELYTMVCEVVDRSAACAHLGRLVLQGHAIELPVPADRLLLRLANSKHDDRLPVGLALLEGRLGMRKDPAEGWRTIRMLCSDDGVRRCEGPTGCDWNTAYACWTLSEIPPPAGQPGVDTARLRAAACHNLIDDACRQVPQSSPGP